MSTNQDPDIKKLDEVAADSGLPTYTELLEKLLQIERWMSSHGTKTQSEMRQEVRGLLARAV